MGLDLTEHHVAVLDVRTEGWIAALQLAALSMQGRSDVADSIAGFSGDDRYIVDFLVEEVLQRQPSQIRQGAANLMLSGRPSRSVETGWRRRSLCGQRISRARAGLAVGTSETRHGNWVLYPVG
jgi:hypothetical protein